MKPQDNHNDNTDHAAAITKPFAVAKALGKKCLTAGIHQPDKATRHSACSGVNSLLNRIKEKV